MRWWFALALAFGLIATPGVAAELSIFAPHAIAKVLAQIGPQFERDQGHKLNVIVDLPETLARRIENGEYVDVFVGPMAQMNRLVQGNKVQAETRVGVARVDMILWFGSIGARSNSPEAAWEFLKFLTHPDTDPVFKAQGMERD